MRTPFEPAPQELVMTLLGGYAWPRESRRVWSGGLVALLTELGFSDGAARIALTRLVRRELLDRQKDGRLVHYRLTRRTLSVLEDGDRRIFSLGRRSAPAGPWTVLWHHVPDDRRVAREQLVRRLRFLGFGSVQDGTWLAPRDLEREVLALLSELEITEYAALMLGQPSAALDIGAFAARAWNLGDLARRYQDFAEDFGRYTKAGARARLGDAGVFALHTRLLHTFREFPARDPELPEDVVPAPAGRSRAVDLFHDLQVALAPAAQRHFDEVTTP